MKLKYFLSFFALVALLSSCSDDDAMTLLDEIKVSSSYVSIDVNGGSNTITLKAKDAWSFDAEEIPEWLTISPMKNAQVLNEVVQEQCDIYGIKRLPSDFKKKGGYKRSIQLSHEYNLYRQNFCGCVYSMREAEEREAKKERDI